MIIITMDLIVLYNVYRAFRGAKLLRKVRNPKEIIQYTQHYRSEKTYTSANTLFGIRRTDYVRYHQACVLNGVKDIYEVTHRNRYTFGIHSYKTINMNVTESFDASKITGPALGAISHMPRTGSWDTDYDQLVARNKYKGRMDVLTGMFIALFWGTVLYYANKYEAEVGVTVDDDDATSADGESSNTDDKK